MRRLLLLCTSAFLISCTEHPTTPIEPAAGARSPQGPSGPRTLIPALGPTAVFPRAVFAASKITLSGTPSIDSYSSIDGPYDPARPGTVGHVATNGSILASGAARVSGSATAVGTIASGLAVSGVRIASAPATPAWGVVSCPSGGFTPATQVSGGTYDSATGTLVGTGAQTITLSGASQYFFSAITLSGAAKLHVATPGRHVDVYVRDGLTLTGQGASGDANVPRLLTIASCGGGQTAWKLSGGAGVWLGLYAPDRDVTMNGNGDLYGAVVASSFTMTGTARVHYDLALGPPAAASARALLTSTAPAQDYQNLLATLAQLTTGLGSDSARVIIRGIEAAAFNPVSDFAALNRLRHALGGRSFTLPTAMPALGDVMSLRAASASPHSESIGTLTAASRRLLSGSGGVRLRLNSTPPKVPPPAPIWPATATAGVTVIFVNGVDTSPLDAADDMLELLALAREAGMSFTTPDHHYAWRQIYNPSGAYSSTVQEACAFSSALLLNQTGQAAINAVLDATCNGFALDWVQSAEQVAQLLNIFPSEAQPAARQLATAMQEELSAGRAVVVVAHSQGNLMLQQAYDLLSPEYRSCVDAVGVASPISSGWPTEPLVWPVVIKGNPTQDFIRALNLNAFPTISTNMSDAFDQMVAGIPKAVEPLAYAKAVGASDIALHSFVDSYLKGDNSRLAIGDGLVHAVADLEARCGFTMAVAPGTSSISVGDTLTLIPTFAGLGPGNRYMTAPVPAPTWASSDPTIAVIDARGTVTGIAPGTTTITARSGDAPPAIARVTVAPAQADGVYDLTSYAGIPVGSEIPPPHACCVSITVAGGTAIVSGGKVDIFPPLFVVSSIDTRSRLLWPIFSGRSAVLGQTDAVTTCGVPLKTTEWASCVHFPAGTRYSVSGVYDYGQGYASANVSGDFVVSADGSQLVSDLNGASVFRRRSNRPFDGFWMVSIGGTLAHAMGSYGADGRLTFLLMAPSADGSHVTTFTWVGAVSGDTFTGTQPNNPANVMTLTAQPLYDTFTGSSSVGSFTFQYSGGRFRAP